MASLTQEKRNNSSSWSLQPHILIATLESEGHLIYPFCVGAFRFHAMIAIVMAFVTIYIIIILLSVFMILGTRSVRLIYYSLNVCAFKHHQPPSPGNDRLTLFSTALNILDSTYKLYRTCLSLNSLI